VTLGGVFLLISTAGVCPQPPHFIGPVEQPLNPLGQDSGISDRHFNAVVSVAERLCKTAPIREDNGQTGRHRFQYDERLSLLLDSGKDEEIGLVQQRRFPLARHLARKGDGGGQPV
jgi:hypothetical protein